MRHAMIDLETLGLGAGASIISIGAVIFTTDRVFLDQTFRCNVSRESCLTWGLKENRDTIAWWNDTDPDLLKSFESDAKSLPFALADLSAWLTLQAAERVWSNGPSFDVAILEYTYRLLHIPIPWKYNASRCCRTIYEIAGIDPKSYPDDARGRAHDPVDDAIFQALVVTDAWRKLDGNNLPTDAR